MKNKKILVISEFIYPPVIETAGMKNIYNLLKKISKKNQLHILTTITHDTDKKYLTWFKKEKKNNDIIFHYINMTQNSLINKNPIIRLIISRIRMFFKTLSLNNQYHFNIIHEYSSIPLLTIYSSILKRLTHVKYIHSIVGYNSSRIANYKYWWGIKYIDKTILAGKEIYFNIQNNIAKKYYNKIAYIPLGLDFSNFKDINIKRNKLLKKYKLDKNKKIITYIGPLEERKGAFLLTKAIKDILANKNIYFLIVTYGKGTIDSNHKIHKTTINKLLMKRNNYKILEGKQDINNIMEITDIYVMPTTNMHGTLAEPTTLLEAMYKKKLIVASDIEAIKNIVINNKEAILFKNKSINSLSRSILKATNLNQKKKEIISQNAFRKALQYDLEIVSNKLTKIYND